MSGSRRLHPTGLPSTPCAALKVKLVPWRRRRGRNTPFGQQAALKDHACGAHSRPGGGARGVAVSDGAWSPTRGAWANPASGFAAAAAFQASAASESFAVTHREAAGVWTGWRGCVPELTLFCGQRGRREKLRPREKARPPQSPGRDI